METHWIARQVSTNSNRDFEESVAQAMEAGYLQGRCKEALPTLPSLPSGDEHEIVLRHWVRFNNKLEETGDSQLDSPASFELPSSGMRESHRWRSR